MFACGTSVKSARYPAESVPASELGLATVTSYSVPGERTGVVAPISAPLITATPVAATPPNLTAAPFWKFRPAIDTGLGTSAGPEVGSIDATDGPGTVKHAENSEVLPTGSVAVAVMNGPRAADGSDRDERGVASGVRDPSRRIPRKRWPGPLPDASHRIVEKNSMPIGQDGRCC